MSQEDITQIRIGNSSVGIMGLKSVIEEMADEYQDKPDLEVAAEILNRLDKRNYIPGKVREEYAKALLVEFKKFLGKPFDEETPAGLEIKVLGPGCLQCDRLEQELMEIMSETGIVADLEHVWDIKEIGKYGVMETPALLIKGKVKSVGKVPREIRLKNGWKGPRSNDRGFDERLEL